MISFKVGTTFKASVQRTHDLERQVPYDITNTIIRSSLYYRGQEFPLTVTKNNPLTGHFDVFGPATFTTLLTPGTYNWDIRYEDNGVVQTAPEDSSIIVHVLPEITS